ncbi:alcohol dehydrogenase catalytic domain-containing protein [Nonomuraea cypriaca]|uniref:alcohol dehydrogenase catalytic domain-containing protein n=1 Tax=Nonomuraea cypriaca TaxID=1187855 RepID=UPI001A9C5278|nr:alcohol dehydrogenase catalytic domain-containing protein [Nonomuraea cypriaca]
MRDDFSYGPAAAFPRYRCSLDSSGSRSRQHRRDDRLAHRDARSVKCGLRVLNGSHHRRYNAAMPTHTMRAIRVHEYGGPEVLRYDEVPIPKPRPGEVLVRVHAVGVNPADWYLRDGLTNLPPETRPKFSLPVIPGTDVSGVVEAVAADVDGLSAGDEVFGLLRFPSFDGSAYAEYVAAVLLLGHHELAAGAGVGSDRFAGAGPGAGRSVV